jgi:hypothetical protein
MGRWLVVGALLGAMVLVVLGAIGWPRHFTFNSPTLLQFEDVTAPGTPVALRAFCGCLLGFLCALIAVVWWNTIVLPAWLIGQTTVPLAKVALGLGLIFTGMIISARNTPLRLFPDTPLLDTLATLLAALGPTLCLEVARKARSSGILLWAVVLQVSGLLLAANPSMNELKFGNFHATWGALLVLASQPLFLVFLRRLARTLERPDLERQARSVIMIMLLAWCLPLVAMRAAGSFFRVFPIVGDASYAPIVLSGALLLPGFLLLVLSFKLIRGLQTEITRRL